MASGGWEELGHVPEEADIDVAERARYILRRGWVLRLHPDLLERWPENVARDRLIELAGQPAVEKDDVLRALAQYKEAAPQWLVEMLNDPPKRLELDGYPTDDGASAGWVLSGQFAEADAGGDESSAAPPAFLDRHLEDVVRAVSEAAPDLLANEEIRTKPRACSSISRLWQSGCAVPGSPARRRSDGRTVRADAPCQRVTGAAK